MNKWKELWFKILKPPFMVYVLTYIISIVVITGSIICLFFDLTVNFPLAILAYFLFGVSAIALTYSVYLIVISRKFFKAKSLELINRFTITRFLLENFGYRKFVFMIWSLIMSMAYSVINLFLGISLPSIWYCSLAGYNIFLVFMRGLILIYYNKKRKDKQRTEYQDRLFQAKTYLKCGILLIILNVSLSIAISEVIFHDMHYTYYSWTIYAFAAFAFYKMSMAIYRIIRNRNSSNLTEHASNSFNLAGACFSIMGLQTALLSTFGEQSINASLFNTITGCFVSAITIAIGIIMVVNAYRHLKKVKMEIKNNG